MDKVSWVRLMGEVLFSAYESEVARQFSREERIRLARKGQAIPVRDGDGNIVNGRYPTPTIADWLNARQAIGRVKSGDRAMVITYLLRRARALGVDDEEIPEEWKS